MPQDDPDWTIDDFDPEAIEIEAMQAVHLGGGRLTASFELSEPEEEVARSYLLDVEFGASLTPRVLLQVEDTMMSHISLSPEEHYALELGGIIHHITPGGATRTQLPEGFLRRLWHLDGQAIYAIGEEGVAYRKDGSGWQQLETYDDATLLGIDGTAPDRIYAAGAEGVVLHQVGTGWQPLAVPGDYDFNAIQVAGDGALWLAGNEGACFGIVDSELVELDAGELDYFGVCEFKGKRYWSNANAGLSVQEGQALVPFRDLGQAFAMHATDEVLAIVGWKEIFLFDGQDWRGFEMVYDGEIALRVLDMAQFP